MVVRLAEAEWKGDLKSGKGSVKAGQGLQCAYSFTSRFESGAGSNPEELLGAAHASCFSMALSNALAGAGFTPTRVHTTAKVHLEKTDSGFAVTKIELETEADVPNIDDAKFQAEAEKSKKGCPISKALSAVPISLNAKLTQKA